MSNRATTMRVALLAATTTLAAACANVSIRKINANGEASGPDGMRYYAPRPYVCVNEPFIAWAKSYIAKGELSVDGDYVSMLEVPEEIAELVKTQTVGSYRILASAVLAEGTSVTGGGAQGDVADPAERASDQQPDGKKSDDEKLDDEKLDDEESDDEESDDEESDDKESVKEKTGQLNLKVANDNSAFAITPLKRYFDIVWLPDFSEQYVVQGSSALGNASIAMQMGQGWSLQGLEASVDNSAFNAFLFDLLEQGSSMLSTLARAKLGLPATTGGAAQGAPSTAKREFSSGTPLSLKITRVRIATPGLYPILKPSELSPAEAKALCDQPLADRILIPIPPMTNIAFNTYETLVIEATRAAGDSPLRLGESVDTKSAGKSASPSGAPGDTQVAALESALNSELRVDDANRWEVRLSRGTDNFTAVVKKIGSPMKTEAEMRDHIRRRVEASGGTIDKSAHITVE